ncbi:MAG: histidine kinase [Hyphomicrobium sp.]|nr:histidine kinase [Hyphomicrobium sp.]
MTLPGFQTVRDIWLKLSLFWQFIAATALVVAVIMLMIGLWVENEIESRIVSTAGAAAVLYTDSIIKPHVQELATADALSDEHRAQLDAVLAPLLADGTFRAFKIWKGDAVVYSSDPAIVGQRFAPTPKRASAWDGHVSFEYGNHNDSSDADVAGRGNLLEIYAPVRDTATGRVIALAETYEETPTLDERLDAETGEGWLVIVAAALGLLGLQGAIVHRGSQTIDRHREALHQKISALSDMLAENEELRARAYKANQRTAEINEGFLRKIGAELHDGPVQLLGMALMRLDVVRKVLALGKTGWDAETDEDFTLIREAVNDSLDEIRNVSVGLAPPEIERLQAGATLELAAQRHMRRTKKPVDLAIGPLPPDIPYAVKSCLYRLAQEGLNNAFRHASGTGQVLSAVVANDVLEVTVSDRGPGFEASDGANFGQGLSGLKERVEALGGEFVMTSAAGRGTRLSARFDLKEKVRSHA